MDLQIREASVEEALEVLHCIVEFAAPISLAELAARLANKSALILVAENQQQLVGVKIGYALDKQVFYSWLGGVLPAGRGRGVAQALLEAQEAWVIDQGYQQLTVKSRNRFPAMVRLLIRNGYLIEDIEKKEGVLDYRLHFRKALVKK
ncbi:GNAT family N-acetyltransferase [Photobacterium leiognathi subsp. mandapamensis]|uniref:GNAT family N-acetyltransferase n=1 Tax=Photobacterium leiognathi TaxID=553611 RepID=UPI000D167A74|nr:GNAT family N-acetyltransferase [Photobacterium leiognathi]PSU99086.1 GNAT family N-acetyltransferase [Photobacterium leiognathi subsp. mandapamensis]